MGTPIILTKRQLQTYTNTPSALIKGEEHENFLAQKELNEYTNYRVLKEFYQAWRAGNSSYTTPIIDDVIRKGKLKEMFEYYDYTVTVNLNGSLTIDWT